MILLSHIHVRVFFSFFFFFFLLFFLLMHTFPTAAAAAAEINEDYCDRAIYGQPDYTSCMSVLYGRGARRGASIYNIDNDEHGFLLPYFGGDGQFTVDQWRHRVYLPMVWHNGTSEIKRLT